MLRLDCIFGLLSKLKRFEFNRENKTMLTSLGYFKVFKICEKQTLNFLL